MKIADHPHDRLRERTLIAPKELDALIARVRDMKLDPKKTYHYEWPDRGYAVIAPARKGYDRHVVKTILGPQMRPPGDKVAGIYDSFFSELSKIATTLYSSSEPTSGLRVAAPPKVVPRAPRHPATTASAPSNALAGTKFPSASEFNRGPTQLKNLLQRYSPPPSPELNLTQVGSEVQRRWGSRVPGLAQRMATQADAAAQAMRAAGGSPEKTVVRMHPNASNSFELHNRSISTSGYSPATLGHEAGHAIDGVVHPPEFFGKRGLFSVENTVPSEVSATRRALSVGNLLPQEVAGVLSGTASYLENEVPALKKSLTDLHSNHLRTPMSVNSRKAEQKLMEMDLKHGRSFTGEPTMQQRVLENIRQSRKAREPSTFTNPFVSQVSPEARAATKRHVELVAAELGKHFSPEHVNAYREHMLSRIDKPSLRSFADFSKSIESARPPQVPAAAKATLPSWGKSIKDTLARVLRRA